MNYRTILINLLIFIAFVSETVFAQNYAISLIGGFSSNTVLRFVRLDGGGSYAGDGAWHTGIGFNKKIKENLRLTSGLVYNQHQIKITPEYFPDVEIVTRTETIQLLSIPLEVRLGFLKYFFFNLGPSLDIDLSDNRSGIDSQSGIGWRTGFGAQFEYEKFIFLINPSLKIHSLPAFKPENYPQHLLESGVSFGVGRTF